MRSRVPIRGGTGKSILTGQTAQTVVQQTIVQQVKGGTSGVGGIASTIWPLIGQIPVNVVDIAALTTPGLVVDTGSHIIARTLTVNAPLTILNPTGAAGNPTISLTTAALTKTDDTNVTLSLGGTPASALVAAVSLTLGWTGQLAVSRGGTGNSALAALTKTDDTNVTLTLGGSPNTALVNAASIAVGWTGTLAVSRGGSGAGTLTGYLKGNGTSAFTANATIPTGDITGLAAIATSGSASDLITGTVPSAQLPTASTSVLGAVKVDGTSITISGGVISSTGGGGTGTVTSVDMTVPSILSVSGNPITTSGTLAVTLATQTANKVFAGPTTGSAAAPTFRSLVAADIPITPAALTKADDTNVTLTLGGTPATALLQAASLTLGWTGTLAVSRGGSGAGTLTGYLKGNGTSAFTASATIPYTDLTGTPTIPTGANPTASVGLAAVNGTATTFLRSDGAPALSQSISPTWSGNHTFAAGWTVTGALAIGPSSSMSAEFGGGQASIYSLGANSSTIGGFRISLRSSGFGNSNNLLASTQSGTAITGVILGDASALPAITLNGAVTIAALSVAPSLSMTQTTPGNLIEAWFNTSNTSGARGWGIRIGSTGSLTFSTTDDSGVREHDAFALARDTSGNVTLCAFQGAAVQGLGPVNTGLVDMTPDASTFTGTLTGMSTTVTNTCTWSRNGNQVTLYVGAATGTSNAAGFTMTGIPAAIQPARAIMLAVPYDALEESGAVTSINPSAVLSGGTLTFHANGSTSWATSGVKGVASGFTVTYLLN